MRWIQNFPSWIIDQLGLVNRGGDFRPHLLEGVQPVVLVEREQTGALQGSNFNDAETINGNAFVVGGVQAAVGGQLSHVQLKNPATSSRIVFIDSILAGGAAAADSIRFGHMDADATTLVGTGINRDNAGTTSGAQLRRMTNAAEQLDTDMADMILPANTLDWMDFNPPIRLAPGEGFTVRGMNVATNLTANFFYREYVQA